MPFECLRRKLTRLDPKFFQWKCRRLVQGLEPDAVRAQALNDHCKASGNVVRRWNTFRFRGFERVLEPHLLRLTDVQSAQHRLPAKGIDLLCSITHQDLGFYIGSLYSRPQREALPDQGTAVRIVCYLADPISIRVREIQSLFQKTSRRCDAFLKCEVGVRFAQDSEAVSKSPVIVRVSRKIFDGGPNPVGRLAFDIAI